MFPIVPRQTIGTSFLLSYFANILFDFGYAKEIKVNEVDYTKQSHIGLHTFFIDDKAIDVNSFKKKNNIDSDLNSWFENNTEYLQKHSVVYKCLVFTFDNGIVNNIKYSEKNFNE